VNTSIDSPAYRAAGPMTASKSKGPVVLVA
jgi:hypothetical protein